MITNPHYGVWDYTDYVEPIHPNTGCKALDKDREREWKEKYVDEKPCITRKATKEELEKIFGKENDEL